MQHLFNSKNKCSKWFKFIGTTKISNIFEKRWCTSFHPFLTLFLCKKTYMFFRLRYCIQKQNSMQDSLRISSKATRIVFLYKYAILQPFFICKHFVLEISYVFRWQNEFSWDNRLYRLIYLQNMYEIFEAYPKLTVSISEIFEKHTLQNKFVIFGRG